MGFAAAAPLLIIKAHHLLEKHGVSWPDKKGKYSINQGIWGTSVGGQETLTSHQNLPEDAWPVPMTGQGERKLSLQFAAGEFVGFDWQTFEHPVAAIQALEAVAARVDEAGQVLVPADAGL